MTELERAVGVERTAPSELLRALRVIDPTAELVYFGAGRWRLGHLVPEDRRIAKAGQRLLASCARVLKVRKRPSVEDYQRHLFGKCRLFGFVPTAEYEVLGEPTAAIVRDQEVMDFLYRTVSAQEADAMYDHDELQRKAHADAMLTDEHRARDAWRYAFTRSHAVTRFDDPTRRQHRSGRTLQRAIA